MLERILRTTAVCDIPAFTASVAASVPARIVFLVDLDQAYSCHVVTETHLDDRWLRLDAVTGERCPDPGPRRWPSIRSPSAAASTTRSWE